MEDFERKLHPRKRPFRSIEADEDKWLREILKNHDSDTYLKLERVVVKQRRPFGSKKQMEDFLKIKL